MELAGALQVVRKVADILERLGVPYLVGGSLASSLHGIPRSTQDADLVVALQEQHVRPLVEALSGVLKVQRGRLDQEYLRAGALHLEVTELLDRALAEAGIATV